jgi:hypothetical protein
MLKVVSGGGRKKEEKRELGPRTSNEATGKGTGLLRLRSGQDSTGHYKWRQEKVGVLLVQERRCIVAAICRAREKTRSKTKWRRSDEEYAVVCFGGGIAGGIVDARDGNAAKPI